MNIQNNIKEFFKRIYSKSFIIICVMIMISGILYSFLISQNIKNKIDIKIREREVVLREIFTVQEQEREKEDIAYDIEYKNFQECILKKKKSNAKRELESSEYLRKLAPSYITLEEIIKERKAIEDMTLNNLTEDDYRVVDIFSSSKDCIKPIVANLHRIDLENSRGGFNNIDKTYRELQKIKRTPFFYFFVMNSGVFLIGVFMIFIVFVINLLLLVMQILRQKMPIFFSYSINKSNIMRANFSDMSPFQKYLLLIAFGILCVLLYIKK